VGRTRWDRILAHDAIDLSSRFGMAAFLAIAGQTGRVARTVPCSSSSASTRIHARNSAMTSRTLRVGPTNDNGADGNVACRSRLGGMLNYYYREAA